MAESVAVAGIAEFAHILAVAAAPETGRGWAHTD